MPFSIINVHRLQLNYLLTEGNGLDLAKDKIGTKGKIECFKVGIELDEASGIRHAFIILL